MLLKKYDVVTVKSSENYVIIDVKTHHNGYNVVFVTTVITTSIRKNVITVVMDITTTVITTRKIAPLRVSL